MHPLDRSIREQSSHDAARASAANDEAKEAFGLLRIEDVIRECPKLGDVVEV